MNCVLLLGGSGVLGSEVVRQLKLQNIDHAAPTSSELDVRDLALLKLFILKMKPRWIVNCAAWTSVDGAEDSFEAALAINETAVSNIAQLAKQISCQVIHVSTDYVFDGTLSEPYTEQSKVRPRNKYGESKLRGELVLLDTIPQLAYIIRTSWLYGIEGKSFVKTMLKKALMDEAAQVVDDQVGSPTSARDLAEAITLLMKNPPSNGIYHFSNKGSCSWYELACSIYTMVGADPHLIEPISSDSLDLKAKRPKFSLLNKEKWDSNGISKIPEWQASLEQILPEIVKRVKSVEKS